jgi:hypothetical protein
MHGFEGKTTRFLKRANPAPAKNAVDTKGSGLIQTQE